MHRGRGRRSEPWKALGRLLPREVRERIYEPAMAELLSRRARQPLRARLPLALHAIAMGIGCVPAAARWGFIRRGTLTPAGRVVLASLAAVVIVALILQRFTRVEGGY